MKKQLSVNRGLLGRVALFLVAAAAIVALCLTMMNGYKAQQDANARETVWTENKLGVDLGVLAEGESVSQPFITESAGSYTFAIYTGAHTGEGQVILSLTDQAGGTVDSITLPTSAFSAESFTDVDWAPVLDPGLYTLTITGGAGGSGASFFYAEYSDFPPEEQLTVRGEAGSNCLCMRIVLVKAGGIQQAVWTVLGFGVMAALLVVLALSLTKCRLETVFLVSALLLGTLFQLVLPPLSAPDERSHYGTAYYFADVALGKGDADFRADGLPGNIQMRSEDYALYTQMPDDQYGYDEFYKPMWENFHWKAELEGTQMAPIAYIPYSAPVYIPGAIGILLGQLLNLSGVVTVLLGRMTSMIIVTLILYMAIRRTPILKGGMAVAALLPMTLNLSASYSADGMIYACAFWTVAEVLRLALGARKLRLTDCIPLLMACLLVAPMKMVYVALPFLAFIIRPARFEKRRDYWIAMATIVVSSLIVWALVNMGNVNTASGGLNLYEGEQYSFTYFLLHPIETISTVGNSMLRQMRDQLYSMVGYYLSWLNVQLPEEYVIGGLALLIFATIKRQDEWELPSLSLGQKSWAGLLTLGTIVLVFLSMLLAYTPFGSTDVLGVQGRYFLPVVPIVMLIARGDWLQIKWNGDRVYVFLVSCLSGAALLSAMNTVLFN